MVSDTATSSRASIISLDPAVASQITGPSFSQTSHSRTGSSPYKPASSSRGHVRNKSVPLQSDKQSLRRAKNSTEVLRQRSTRSNKKISKLEPIADPRGGRNFTVGNVGMGGLLYLKPSPHQNASGASPPVLMPLTAPPDLAYGAEKHPPQQTIPIRSDTTSPALRSASPRTGGIGLARRPTIETMRHKHGRSQSFSTVDEHQNMVGRSKTMKVVINRPDTARTGPEQHQEGPWNLSLPALEVPIPHYRLGDPRFSTNGTPILRGSVFSRESATPSEATEVGVTHPQRGQTGGPPPASMKSFAKIEAAGNHSNPQVNRHTGSSSSASTIHDRIRPEIYDALANVYDDPHVVRYSHNVREITAATPARLIAQISSESFMDYELVSDFFLTFRSYMSVFTVLDLLLARLRWAINRQENDGRIIRVRTFAALRHWILNYFVDDFIPDYKLRNRFCSEINLMYREVANRRSAGTSDLKVLRDLKRCWNGRCSMYWDEDEFNLNGDQDEDLQPGGFEENEAAAPDVVAQPPPLPRNVRTVSNSSWFNVPPLPIAKTQHTRQDSGKQPSVASEQSLQAKSCSIPKNLLKPGDVPGQDRGSHPVPVQLRRPNASGNLEVKTGHLGHRRGAASVDSDREPTPRNEKTEFLQMFEGSLIRGSIYAPSAPFVQIISSPSALSAAQFEVPHNPNVRTDRRASPQSAHGPGVKNIFGSLRKALGGRHGHSDMSLVTVSAPMPVQDEGRTPRAQMPMNMSKSHDELRARAQSAQVKGQLRVDLLCAQVAQNYELLFPHTKYAHQTIPPPRHRIFNPPARNQEKGSGPDRALLTPDLRQDRLPSHTTAQSGSILIVNDTGMGVPEMSGALPTPSSLREAWEAQKNMQAAYNETAGLGIQQERPNLADISPQRSSDALGEMIEAQPDASTPELHYVDLDRSHTGEDAHSQAIASSSPRPQPHSPAVSSSTHRRNRSDQSTQPSRKVAISESPASSASPANAAPAHGLRRRPGGDLRNVENVHDLPQHHQHDSVDTTHTADSSSRVPSAAIPSTQPTKKTVSMINTHSSQHLRPSFEQAVAPFSHIPDDDDGGLEATLLKLEGRYEKSSPPLPQHPLDTLERRRSMPEMSARNTYASFEAAEAPDVPRGYVHQPNQMVRGSVDDFDLMDSSQPYNPPMDSAGGSRKSSIFGLPVASDDEDDYGPTPLLKQDTNSASAPNQFATRSVPRAAHLQRAFEPQDTGPRSANAILQTTPAPYVRPETAGESARSFLLDEDENLSDLSSEISVDVINYAPNQRSMSPMLAAPGTAVSGLEIPAHPLTYASVVNLAPPEFERDSSVIRDSQYAGPFSHLPLPKTMSGLAQQYGNLPTGGPAHIPFVLAADSQTLAQQMTLIEKSALTEIEWSDLVGMKWHDSSSKILDWAEYLTLSDIQGVDLVITRFNLVSRWVRSEIVLTQDIEERAQVITKLIHVAAHARRLHNYATMVQITIGLSSTDTTRLAKTWARVPEPDKSLLKNMERLVQPIRNFADLRQEIESADFSDGCIPFLGLYVHDLTYNAQKPSTIPAGVEGGEALINFERYRTAAVIVKTLLRLIDASTRYSFEPIRGIVERCLWMGALPDDRIYALSRALEVA
jgi:hypothetical protein